MNNTTGKTLVHELSAKLASLGDRKGLDWYVSKANQAAQELGDDEMLRDPSWRNPVDDIMCNIHLEVEDAIANCEAEDEDIPDQDRGAARLLSMIDTNSSSTGLRKLDYDYYAGTLPLPQQATERIRQHIATLGKEALESSQPD
jgi:hypothetical protein